MIYTYLWEINRLSKKVILINKFTVYWQVV